uniref:SAM domain, SH3 domain and nuclear localisation signals 1b n=1 Tax=Astyanax mexicanus TaxID=7994 RepID=A0A3B1JTD9_ASTMX
MNLFCFTLDGSTDSLYELPQRSPAGPELSPVPRRRPCSPRCLVDSGKWGGSEPCIALNRPQTPRAQLTKADSKKAKRKCQNLLQHHPVQLLSQLSVATSDDENTVSSNAYWPCSRKTDESVHSKNHQSEGVAEDAYITKSLGQEEEMEMKPETRDREHPLQGVNFEAWNPNREICESKQHETGGEGESELETEGTLKKIQKLVRVKKNSKDCSEESRKTPDSSGHSTQTHSKEGSPVITCIGLSKRPEKKHGKELLQQQHQQPEPAKEMDIMELEGPWSPGPFQHWTSMDCSPAWELSHHTCHRPTADQHFYSFDFHLACGAEWDRFEEMFHGLDHLRRDHSPDLEITDPTRSSSFGRFDTSKHSPQTKAEEHEGTLGTDGESPEGEHSKGGIGKKMKAISMTMRKKMGRKYVKALSEEVGEDLDRDHEGETPGSNALGKDCRRSSNSVESLYSLHSGQSTSSGVTSGSDGSSNRDSLRLEEELPYTGQFCGRAKVHTDFVPSPYDAESLKLKAGDMIDIISKSPNGIWTGMLNNKVGNFKFIYVDVLAEEPAPIQRMRPNRKSRRPRPKTLQELLERLNLEEHVSSLLLNGYQTVEDLKDLKEQHLIELNVTDPEHRQRLLAATECLQDAELSNQKDGEGEDEPKSPTDPVKVEQSDCPRDSGCYIASDCSDNSKEDTDNHLPSLDPPAAQV